MGKEAEGEGQKGLEQSEGTDDGARRVAEEILREGT